jgi:hypothetical protein
MDKLKAAMKEVIDGVSKKYTDATTFTNADVMALGQSIMDNLKVDEKIQSSIKSNLMQIKDAASMKETVEQIMKFVNGTHKEGGPNGGSHGSDDGMGKLMELLVGDLFNKFGSVATFDMQEVKTFAE